MKITKITSNTNISFKNNSDVKNTNSVSKDLNTSVRFQQHKNEAQLDNLTARKNPFKALKDKLHRTFSSLTDDVNADTDDYNRVSDGYFYVLA